MTNWGNLGNGQVGNIFLKNDIFPKKIPKMAEYGHDKRCQNGNFDIKKVYQIGTPKT